jgi:glyoxylase-like metal-dependent hydrolase (beta-lactamase superfamily II)
MLSVLRRCSVLLFAAASALAAQAPPRQGGLQSPLGQIQLQPVLIKTGLYMISGGGANSVLRLSGDGLLLVDGKLTAAADPLQRLLRKIAEQPVRGFALTSDDPDKTGYAARAVESGVQLYIHQNLKAAVAASTAPLDASLDRIPQIQGYDRQQTLYFGGVEAQLLHFGNAHTSGDTVVYFPDKKAVALGELYAFPPDPDFARGGSLADWNAVLGEVLKLDFSVAIPAQGPAVNRAAFEAYKARIDTLLSRAAEAVRKRVPKAQFNAELNGELKAAGIDWQVNFSPEQVDGIYAEFPKGR